MKSLTQKEIKVIINKLDFMDLLDSAPEDEYDLEVAEIYKRSRDATKIEEFVDIVDEVFQEYLEESLSDDLRKELTALTSTVLGKGL